ncbi:MAG TPA: hypothetical protein VMW72_18870 [Sedimentisphaerales bacterium]|nr:hypothetical protein [Sedimentisphaerales bacterium]
MNTTEALLAIVSVISFGLAVLSFVRTEIKKANERANIEIMRERLNALHQGIESLFFSIDAIIQIPKHRDDVSVKELQDLGRVVRGNIYLLSQKVRKSRAGLDKWQFGKMIESDQINGIAKNVDINLDKSEDVMRNEDQK